jgi:hypothetical protein
MEENPDDVGLGDIFLDRTFMKKLIRGTSLKLKCLFCEKHFLDNKISNNLQEYLQEKYLINNCYKKYTRNT